MPYFIMIDGLPYLFDDGKAFKVSLHYDGYTVGEVFREGISPLEFPLYCEVSIKAQCQGRLDSIGSADTAEKPKRKRKKVDAE